jgi:hypothetical protein
MIETALLLPAKSTIPYSDLLVEVVKAYLPLSMVNAYAPGQSGHPLALWLICVSQPHQIVLQPGRPGKSLRAKMAVRPNHRDQDRSCL